MDHLPEEDTLTRTIRTAQIVVGAILLGGIATGAARFQAGRGRSPAGGFALTVAALVMFVVALVLWFFLPAMLVNWQRKRIRTGRWRPPRTRGCPPLPEPTTDRGRPAYVLIYRTILGCALFSAPLIFEQVAYFSEGQIAALILAAAGFVGVALQMPTQTGGRQWIEDQLRLMEEERHYAA